MRKTPFTIGVFPAVTLGYMTQSASFFDRGPDMFVRRVPGRRNLWTRALVASGGGAHLFLAAATVLLLP